MAGKAEKDLNFEEFPLFEKRRIAHLQKYLGQYRLNIMNTSDNTKSKWSAILQLIAVFTQSHGVPLRLYAAVTETGKSTFFKLKCLRIVNACDTALFWQSGAMT